MNKTAATVLVVDDDKPQRHLLKSFLEQHHFNVLEAESAEDALDRLESCSCSMIISDMRMPGMSGLQMLQTLRDQNIALPVLLVTAYADIQDAVTAVKDGALNYLEKPIDFNELLQSVQCALHIPSVASASLVDLQPIPENILINSPSMNDLVHDVALVAPSDSRVLISGESGTGKEVVADLIHQWSLRHERPFHKVNCASLSETLLESELFGHEKGAFTGALEARAGLFEYADGGTVFLDEIGETSLSLQAKLLRVIQDGQYCPVGSNDSRHADVRIIAATNRVLQDDISNGSFRQDLYYRLSVIELYVPALRDRPEDIVPLAKFFAEELGGGKVRLADAAMAALALYDWPGNVRELRNAIERASLLSRGSIILPEHLPRRIADGAPDGHSRKEEGRMAHIERTVILETLRQQNYNRSETARVLGISRRALIYKLNRFAEDGYPIQPD